MKSKKMLYIPILLGTLLTGCSCVVIYKKDTNTGNETISNKGKFVIRMDNDETSLKMDVHSSFDSLTDFIEDTDIPSISGAYSYKWFSEIANKKFSDIHNEYSESLMGKDKDGIQFYKFTFFIKNTGDSDASYYMDINLGDIDNNKTDEYIRTMVFEGPNKQTVFAKRSQTDTANDGKELIDGSDESLGVAEIINDKDITIGPNTLGTEENIKFTLLFWLEGGDSECKDIPDNVYLNVEVNIKGYK